jgi:hypothetical protein
VAKRAMDARISSAVFTQRKASVVRVGVQVVGDGRAELLHTRVRTAAERPVIPAAFLRRIRRP